ncbi:DUF544-domain-containing protein [Gloeophyllum trabeum ATCC 11539]|uniref:DUF544-domain-containing protein n=1 Tax=Gloeophyllum trabeum (strain ATCC 11539 / FP-39264 / Madison 617) TaxID=670483 RepID=S7Q385_GLOTA|nr:DUF544-domain-containing protein [Gloeophyllum trabeum ATCC 11539]EPQ53953.1 DUF544-domain-containing protein [Gloeophyllum trabeum ATCC 11539]
MASNPVRSSLEDVWYLKEIVFGTGPSRKRRKIITQNFNGPCSFIAICNILLLRDKIEILPHDRRTVSYEMLSQLVAEYLLTNCPDVDISAALSIMPKTTKGMDLNPLFTGATSFRPGGDGSGGELKLFEQAGIKLVHGWLADPESSEYPVLARVEDYDNAVNLIVEADHATQGRLVVGEQAEAPSAPSGDEEWSEEQRRKVEDAIVIRNFLDSTQSQLTYYGLFHLASTLPPDSLVALFRNSHLSVLYKSPAASPSPPASTMETPETDANAETQDTSSTDSSALYTLVTDMVFLHEPTVVWERLEDVEGSASSFVDSDFKPSSPAGGDWAGMTAEQAAQAQDQGNYPPVDPEDQVLAQRLQEEEDAQAQALYERQQQEHTERERKLREMRTKASAERERYSAPGMKKKSSCVIM